MAKNGNATPQDNSSHMPDDSVFYDKVIPSALIFMGVITAGLIIFAVAIIFGWIAF